MMFLELTPLIIFQEAISKTLNTGLTHQQTIAHTTNDGVRWLDTFYNKFTRKP